MTNSRCTSSLATIYGVLLADEHRMAGEKDAVAHNNAIKTRLAAKWEESLWRKVPGELYATLFVMDCLTLVVLMFIVPRGLSGPC